VAGCVGWFRDVLPHEKEETVEVREELTVISTSTVKSKGCRWRQISPGLCFHSKYIQCLRELEVGWQAA